MTSENSRGNNLTFRFCILLFALIFCWIQVSATFGYVSQYFERADWPEVTSTVTQAEYLGEEYDSDTGYYAEWQLYVSYEYEGKQYETPYPDIQETDRYANGEQFVGRSKVIVLNPHNRSDIGEKVEFADLIPAIVVSLILVVAVILALWSVIKAVKTSR